MQKLKSSQIKMKKFILFLFILQCLSLSAQNYILENEEVVFSFNTKNGKKLVLAKDKENQYIVYRFGTLDKIEIEYPEKNKESWSKFTYGYYLRGGGKQNAGMELESVFFQIDNFQYTIYKNYYSENNSFETGIKVKNVLNDTIVDIIGKYKTIKGSFYKLRDEELIEEDKDRIDE